MQDSSEVTEEELERLERLCDAATKGPWKSWLEGRDHWGGSHVIIDGEGDDIELSGTAATPANHDFIAAARQAVPRLIAEIRALRQSKSNTKRG
ncbi:MAG: hypothetical protein SF069_15970 [Phycisphaerae bacterium]|nr:hypothetical protein [Phycisphaerae bacterium]